MPIATPYEDLLRLVLERGTPKSDRTGTGTRSLFGHQMRFDLDGRFPADHHQEGAHQVDHLRAAVVPARRDQRAVAAGTRRHHLGRMGLGDRRSGPRLRRAVAVVADAVGRHIDQISAALELLKTDPDSRRIIVSAWNVGEIPQMALPPCHAFFQFYVADGRLSCQLYQRSADIFLGVPFNIASYALLTHMMAAQAGLDVGEFVWTGGDCHIYHNHVEQVTEQLAREPRPYPDSFWRRVIRSSTTPTRTSRSWTTTRTRRSRRPWRYDSRPDLGPVDLRRHRPRRRHPVAAARRPGAVQGTHHGPHRRDGPADLGIAAGEGAAAAGPQKCRSHPASCYMADGAEVVTTLEDVPTGDETWVIGGEQVYALALPIAKRCEVTEVEIDLPREDSDAVAPVLDEAWVGTTGEWLTSSSGLRYRFDSYQCGHDGPECRPGAPDRRRRAGLRRGETAGSGDPRTPAAAHLADPGVATGFGVGGGAGAFAPCSAGSGPMTATSSIVRRGATRPVRRGSWSSTGRTRRR